MRKNRSFSLIIDKMGCGTVKTTTLNETIVEPQDYQPPLMPEKASFGQSSVLFQPPPSPNQSNFSSFDQNQLENSPKASNFHVKIENLV